MEAYFQQLLTNGGPAGFLVVLTVLLLGLWLRHKGWLFDSPKSAAPDTARLADLSAQIGSVRDRLAKVESDMRLLPTREEIHALQLGHARMGEQLAAMDRTATATQSAVLRIENFMIEASQRERSRK